MSSHDCIDWAHDEEDKGGNMGKIISSSLVDDLSPYSISHVILHNH